MSKPKPKFKLDQRARETFTGKSGTIKAMYWSDGDEHNKAQWCYTFWGWLYYPEEDMEAIE